MSKNNLDNHILETYFILRVGMGIIGLLFPLVLWFVGLGLGIDLQGSMSAYYHTPMRNVFVGFLFAIGPFLYLYKGFSGQEDLTLNLAGIFALGIALFPTEPTFELECETFTAGYIHGVSALSFFFAIAYVCLFRASDTLFFVT